jgi:predicted DNA-binding transcriptional regulator AlpA
VIPASDMTIWRWQRDSEIAFPVPVKLGDNGRNYWWLPDVRAWMRRREERQPQAVRHLVIRGNGGSSNNTDLPAGTSAEPKRGCLSAKLRVTFARRCQ